jgi:hypothetical protein
VGHPDTFRERTTLLFERAWKAYRSGGPEAAPELCASLERVALTAEAGKDRKLARRARRAARRFAKIRSLESHRRLLARLRRLGLLSPEAAATLDARWEELARECNDRARQKMRGRRIRTLRRALSRRRRNCPKDLARPLERVRRENAERLEPLAADASDRDLRRFRAAVSRARDLSLALSDAGGPRLPALREREGRVVEALDRWNEIGALRRILRRELRACESRGAVTLARELDRLLPALDGSLLRARRDALKAARATSNVVAFQRRSA